jgi:hypothetical protein
VVLHVLAIRRFDECQRKTSRDDLFSVQVTKLNSYILIVGCDWALKCSRYCFVSTRNDRVNAFVIENVAANFAKSF